MDSHAITVSSLGRIASIGDLYDARRDSFCGPSVFCKDIPTSAITIIDDPDMKTEFVYSDRVSDKFKKLDVNAELQVSILSGLVKLAGSGRYLNDQKSSARSVKISLIYNIKTKFEKLNILHQDLEDALATNISGKDYATHIVTGISWGANSIISCSFENEENRDVTEVAGEMSAAMNKLSWSIDGKGKLDYTGGETGSDKSFKIKVCGDVFPKGKKLPTTIEAAMEFVKQIPELVVESNSGKGKPLAYTLTPIKFLQNQFQMNISFAASLRTLEENSLLRVVHFVEHLTTVKQQLNDFYDDANSFKYSIPYKELINIADLKTNFAIYEASFRTKLSSTLTDLRSGKENTSTLEQLLENFQKQDSSPDKVLLELEGLSKIKKKFNFARASK